MVRSSSADRYGRWIDREPCSCDRKHWKVFKVKHLTVPLMSEFGTGAFNTAKFAVGIFTAGISTWFNGGIARPEHHCLEIRTMCDICQKNIVVTFEFGDYGSRYRFGEYTMIFGMESKHDIDIDFRFHDFEVTYRLLWKLESNAYSAFNFNCIHYTALVKREILNIVSISLCLLELLFFIDDKS